MSGSLPGGPRIPDGGRRQGGPGVDVGVCRLVSPQSRRSHAGGGGTGRLVAVMRGIHDDSDGTYGSPRMTVCWAEFVSLFVVGISPHGRVLGRALWEAC